MPTTAIIGFPMRAARDSNLSIDDLRILICVGALSDADGSCAQDTRWIARKSDLPEPIVVERLGRLRSLGYVRHGGSGRSALLSLVPDQQVADNRQPAPNAVAVKSATRRAVRSGKAMLHGDLLRRRTRRTAPSIEFDDMSKPHPAVESFLETADGQSGGVGRFRFWLKTILAPEDVEVFSRWANRQSSDYRNLVRQFDRAYDDQAIESLLDDTLALVDMEKTANR